MSGTARTIRGVAVRRHHDLSLKCKRTISGGVEIVYLEPQRDTVAVRVRGRVADPCVVVADIERMQLEHEPAASQEPLVLLTSMPAVAAEKLTIEATTPLDFRHRDQRLWTHGRGVGLRRTHVSFG